MLPKNLQVREDTWRINGMSWKYMHETEMNRWNSLSISCNSFFVVVHIYCSHCLLLFYDVRLWIRAPKWSPAPVEPSLELVRMVCSRGTRVFGCGQTIKKITNWRRNIHSHICHFCGLNAEHRRTNQCVKQQSNKRRTKQKTYIFIYNAQYVLQLLCRLFFSGGV